MMTRGRRRHAAQAVPRPQPPPSKPASPSYPAAVTAAATAPKSMHPSPMWPRPSRVSAGGGSTPVAHLEADDPPPGPGDLVRQPRVPPDVVSIHYHAHGVSGKLWARSTASPRLEIMRRSAQNIGCSGSMPSRTLNRRASGTSEPIASAIIRRARPRSRSRAAARRRPAPACRCPARPPRPGRPGCLPARPAEVSEPGTVLAPSRLLAEITARLPRHPRRRRRWSGSGAGLRQRPLPAAPAAAGYLPGAVRTAGGSRAR